MTRRHRAPGWWASLWRALRQAPTRLSMLALTGCVAAVLLVALSLVQQVQAVEAERRAAETKQTVDRVARPLAALCWQDDSVRARLGDDVCDTAQQVVERPPAPRDGVDGRDGHDGRDGRGIVSTVINNAGHLVVAYSDGAQVDVGPVVGKTGEQGRGIVDAAIQDGRLVLSYSDGTTQDVGRIVGERGAQGEPGRGIVSTEIVNGRLVVTYGDGTTEDAGQLPPGPAGPAGPAGPPGPRGEAGAPPERLVLHQQDTQLWCVRSGGPDAAPEYDCAADPAGP